MVNLGQRLNKVRFGLAVKKMQQTPILKTRSGGPVLLSMVHHRDVLSYLLASKSFARFVAPSNVVIVADPSITEADRELLKLHIPDVCFRNAAEFHCPDAGKFTQFIKDLSDDKSLVGMSPLPLLSSSLSLTAALPF